MITAWTNRPSPYNFTVFNTSGPDITLATDYFESYGMAYTNSLGLTVGLDYALTINLTKNNADTYIMVKTSTQTDGGGPYGSIAWTTLNAGANVFNFTATADDVYLVLSKVDQYSEPDFSCTFNLVELVITGPQIPLAELSLEVFTPVHNLAAIPLAELTVEAFAPYRYADIPLAEVGLAIYTPAFGPGPFDIPLADELSIDIFTPSYIWALPAAAYPAAQVIYRCILTGDQESPPLDDLVLPMSSFQCRLRDGDPSYLACVIPSATNYADDISARANGEIVVGKGYRLRDGTVFLEEIARVDFESVAIDRGARSASVTITGHKTTSSGTVKERALTGVSYSGLQADGKRRTRTDVDMFLRPGDTAIYEIDGADESYIAGQISYTVGPNQSQMEVTEA